jgi:hypothetical protein
VSPLSYDRPWTAKSANAKLLVSIFITYPESVTFHFSDAPISDTSIEASGASVGMCSFVVTGAIELGGDDRDIEIAIRNAQYVAGDASTAITQYPDLASLLTHYHFRGASCRIREYCSADGISDWRTILEGSWVDSGTTFSWGTISDVTGITAESVTLTITRSEGMRRSTVPAKSVVRGTNYVSWEPPDLSRGLSIPMRLGAPWRVPHGWETQYAASENPDDVLHLMRLSKAQSCWLPARLTQEADYLTTWYSSDQPGSLGAYTPAGQNPIGAMFVPELDTLALLEELTEPASTPGSSDTASLSGGFYYWTLPGRQRKARAWVIPSEVAYNPAFLSAENAIDRRMDTYLRLQDNQEVRFAIPNIGNLGLLRPNLDEVVVRIEVYLMSRPPGSPAVANGSFKLGMKGPTDSEPPHEWLFTRVGEVDNVDSINANVTAWRMAKHGTRWILDNSDLQNNPQLLDWNFTATADEDDIENVAHHNHYIFCGASHVGRPLEIAIKADAACNAYIVAVGLSIIYWHGREKSKVVNYSGGYRDFANAGIDAVGFVSDTRKRKEQERQARKAAQRTEIKKPEPVDPEGVYTWFPGFYDAAGAYGGVVNQWIESPGAILNYLAQRCTDRPFQIPIGTSTTPGSVICFDDIMLKWSQYTGATTRFLMDWWSHEGAPTFSELQKIMAELPGLPRIVEMSDGKPGLVAMTPSHAFDLANYAHASSASIMPGLLPHRDILRGGNPDFLFELLSSPDSDICNQVKVLYDYDPIRRRFNKIAFCGPLSSDDGYGNAWPVTPGSGLTAAALCAFSQTTLGYGVREKTLELYYIQDSASAVAVGLSCLWRNFTAYRIVRFRGGLPCHDVLPGQLIKFDDSIRTRLGLACPIPLRSNYTWTGFYWHVLTNKRVSTRQGLYHEIYAMAHMNNQIGPVSREGIAGEQGRVIGAGEGPPHGRRP